GGIAGYDPSQCDVVQVPEACAKSGGSSGKLNEVQAFRFEHLTPRCQILASASGSIRLESQGSRYQQTLLRLSIREWLDHLYGWLGRLTILLEAEQTICTYGVLAWF